jgi:hypothetical protein
VTRGAEIVDLTFRSSHPVHTTDIAEATEIVSRTYLPTSLVLTGNGRLNLRMNAIQLPALTAGIVHFGADIVVQAAEVGHYFVNVPLSGWAVNRWMDGHRETTSVGSAAVFSPGTPVAVTWSGDCGQLCMKVVREEMHAQLEALLNRAGTHPVAVRPALRSGHSEVEPLARVGADPGR